ncbi:MAG: hypothetical protein ACM362_14010 [Candidatus Methylomirabilota bacterium]
MIRRGERLASGPEVATLSPELLECQAGTGEREPAAVPSRDLDPVAPPSVAGITGKPVRPPMPGQPHAVGGTLEELAKDALDPVGARTKPVELFQEGVHAPVKASQVAPQALPPHS